MGGWEGGGLNKTETANGILKNTKKKTMVQFILEMCLQVIKLTVTFNIAFFGKTKISIVSRLYVYCSLKKPFKFTAIVQKCIFKLDSASISWSF